MANVDQLNEQWKSAMDKMVHGANAFDRQSSAAAVAFYDHLARLMQGEGVESINCDEWIAEVQVQQSAEVLWGVGDTLGRPPVLGDKLRLSLVVPNNTQLDSTAELTQAALKRYPELAERLAEVGRGSDALGVGSIVPCGNVGEFSSLNFAICREPGQPKLRNLEDCLRAAMQGEEYRPTRVSIPVWGRQEQIDTWVNAIWHIVLDAPKTQLGVRLPLILMFRPDDEQLGKQLERKLIERGILVARLISHEYLFDPQNTVDAGIALNSVRPAGLVSLQRFMDWCARGVRLPETVWQAHIQTWREVNNAE